MNFMTVSSTAEEMTNMGVVSHVTVTCYISLISDLIGHLPGRGGGEEGEDAGSHPISSTDL